MPAVRQFTALVLVALAAGGVTGCSSEPELSATSTCQEFLNAPAESQDAAVSRLAGELRAPEALGLGRPNVDTRCASSPTQTLGWAIKPESVPDARDVAEAGKGEVSVTVGSPDATVKLDIYDDFQGPAGAVLATSTSEALSEIAASGSVLVRIHPMSFLDSNLGNDTSARTANALKCAEGADQLIPFRLRMYEAMPKPEGTGLTDDQILAAADASGISGEEFTSCVTQRSNLEWAERVQQEADSAGITSVPTILVNGVELRRETEYNAETLRSLIP